MHIGELAKQTGASPKAIRHYETLGLLGHVPRTGAYRVYASRYVLLVNLIRQAQSLGFKLSELTFLNAAQDHPDWGALAPLIERKRENIAAEIRRLQQLDIELQEVKHALHRCLGAQQHGEPMRASCEATFMA